MVPARDHERHLLRAARRGFVVLPTDLPPRSTVFRWFALWRDTGVFESMNHLLVMADRERVGRGASPSAAVIAIKAPGPLGGEARDLVVRRHRTEEVRLVTVPKQVVGAHRTPSRVMPP